MEIPRSMLDSLTREIDALSDAGRQMVANAVANSEWSTASELIEVMSEVMDAVCGEVSDMSAALAAEFYDDVRELAVGSRLGSTVESGRDPAATAAAVRAIVRSVVGTGSSERIARGLADRVDYEARRAAGECVYGNAGRDPIEVRFARVPSGSETCPFCIMLASRGYAYRSDRSAGRTAGHYHANCDCRIVPCFDSHYAGPSRRLSPSTTVEGYDPDGLYRRYVQDLRDGRLSLGDVDRYSSRVLGWNSARFGSYMDFVDFVNAASDIEDLQLRCAVVELEWPKTGLSDRYYSQLRQSVLNRRSTLAGDAFYEKPRAGLEEHERRGVDHLLRNGIVPTVKTEDPRAPANFDLEIDGELWEMKNVTNGRGSVGNQLSRARRKFYKFPDLPKRFVFTCEGASCPFDDIVSGVEGRMREGEIAILIGGDGEIRRIEK